jgi:hypothetical protein
VRSGVIERILLALAEQLQDAGGFDVHESHGNAATVATDGFAENHH